MMNDEVAMKAMLPCPFCGGRLSPIGFGSIGYGVGKPLWRWSCYKCHANGPVTETVELAGKLWNRRAVAAVSDGDGEAVPE